MAQAINAPFTIHLFILLISCSALVRQGKLGLEMDPRIRGDNTTLVIHGIDENAVIPAQAGIHLMGRHGFPHARE
ncbi:hypothetical protein [Limnohabitans sp.]|uniref:hypothetical protein n=1 Tax=Limnohabitans sp. TaxID=1907725 RepID=UPI0025C0D989|nr:hypothetical protein [Limnohabitans sp.]